MAKTISPILSHRPDGRPDAAIGGLSMAYSAGLRLACKAPVAVGCDLESVETRPVGAWRDILGQHEFQLAMRLAEEAGEDLAVAATRVWTAKEALKKAGLPNGAPFVFEAVGASDWVTMRTGSLEVASVVLRLEGLRFGAAFAIDPLAAPAPLANESTERTSTERMASRDPSSVHARY